MEKLIQRTSILKKVSCLPRCTSCIWQERVWLYFVKMLCFKFFLVHFSHFKIVKTFIFLFGRWGGVVRSTFVFRLCQISLTFNTVVKSGGGGLFVQNYSSIRTVEKSDFQKKNYWWKDPFSFPWCYVCMHDIICSDFMYTGARESMHIYL